MPKQYATMGTKAPIKTMLPSGKHVESIRAINFFFGTMLFKSYDDFMKKCQFMTGHHIPTHVENLNIK